VKEKVKKKRKEDIQAKEIRYCLEKSRRGNLKVKKRENKL
jgi:hypothetical protein